MTSDEDPRPGSCWLAPCWLALMASLGLIPFSLQSGNWHMADIQWIPGQTLPAPAFLTKWNVFVWNVFYSHGKIGFFYLLLVISPKCALPTSAWVVMESLWFQQNVFKCVCFWTGMDGTGSWGMTLWSEKASFPVVLGPHGLCLLLFFTRVVSEQVDRKKDPVALIYKLF